MSELVDWGNIGGNDKGSNKNTTTVNGKEVEFLRLKPGKKYCVRLVHKPIEIHRYFNKRDGRTYSAITKDPANCPIREKYNINPSLRYAINVIDREDGKLKVMEAPVTVFRHFKNWAENTKCNPGGKDGGDFVITVTRPANGNQMQTKYDATFIEKKPFTEEEKNMVQQQGLYPLKEIFKPSTTEELEKILFGVEDNTSSDDQDPFSNESSASNGAAPEKQNTDSSDDPMDW